MIRFASIFHPQQAFKIQISSSNVSQERGKVYRFSSEKPDNICFSSLSGRRLDNPESMKYSNRTGRKYWLQSFLWRKETE